MAQVELKNICKSYNGEAKVVDNVNITINDKEFVVLVGPSGCGKSTTLRMVAGLEAITEGEILIDDKIVNEVEPKDRDIAMVFQNYALYPHMTVFENMAFGLKIRKYSKEEIKSRVEEASKILGLEDLLERKPKALSGGQRQRVAVGRAIVRKPKVFLFDEPLSNLDAKLRVQMRTEISKLHNELQATIIYVTHDQVEAMTMGDRIVVMKDGIVQQMDNPLEIYKHPKNKFVASFIGSPAMNFIEGKIEKVSKLFFVSDNNELKLELDNNLGNKLKQLNSDKVTLGIRPEDFSLLSVGEKDFAKLDVRIDLAEPLGNETYAYFTIDDNQMIARLVTDKIMRVGDSLALQININKVHLFDGNGISLS
jgi:multiple sugar transport system ATP-binding protein